MGCSIDNCDSPANLHHIKSHFFSKNDLLVIPLCKFHHQDGPHGEAYHNGTRTFEMKHGSQWKLFIKVLDHMARKLFGGKKYR